MSTSEPVPSARSASARRGPSRRGLLAAIALGLAISGGMAGCGALDEQQRRWIFQPGDRTWWGGAAAAEGMQDVWIEYEAPPTQRRWWSGPAAPEPVRLHGLWLPQASAQAPVVLYLHGARWDVRGSAPRMRRLHELGFAVLGIDYRGFGQSSAGLPSQAMAVQDADAAWRWLARHHPQGRRYLFGHSLGGAIAVELATQADGLAGLIVEGTFPSIEAVVRTHRWGWLPVGPLITQRFDAGSLIGQVRVPVLVVHGSEDRWIPPALGKSLYERAAGPKRFELVQGGSHHNTNALGQPQYRRALEELFGLQVPAQR